MATRSSRPLAPRVLMTADPDRDGSHVVIFISCSMRKLLYSPSSQYKFVDDDESVDDDKRYCRDWSQHMISGRRRKSTYFS